MLNRKTTSEIVQKQGFALIASLSIMVLLVMITVGMLTLSTSEVRKSTQDKYQLEAQANARMALSIAIGKLQVYASQDQRITATASILDADSTTENIEGVSNPHWVGVWRSDGLKSEDLDTGLIQQTDGPVTDRRENGYIRENEVLEWLVSGSNLDPTKQLSREDELMIFKAAASAPTSDQVTVKKVKLENSGHYAFWVADEGVKARVNLEKATDKQSTFSKTESYEKLLSPNTFDSGALYSEYLSVTNQDLVKLVDINQIPLAAFGSPTDGVDLKESIQHYSHDLTTSSMSVLSDPINGGLKRNLTAFLNSTGSVPALGDQLGITDNSPIIENIDERDTITPKFGAARDWVQLKNLATGSRGNRTINMTYANTSPSTSGSFNDPAYVPSVDIANYTKQAVQPILLDATYQLSYGRASGTRMLYEFIYPRVVLWNPYNVKLKTPKLYITMDFDANLQNHRIEYPGVDSKGNPETKRVSLGINYNFNYEEQYGMHFMIPPRTFEPGECLHFTAAESRATLLGKASPFARNPGTIDINELSASSDPNERFCFFREARHNNGKGGIIKLDASVDMSRLDLKVNGPVLWEGNKPTQGVYMYAANGSGTAKYNDLGQTNFPVIQKTHLDNYARGNNGRWTPSYNPTGFLEDISVVLDSRTPDSLIGYGMRWRHFYESTSNRTYGAALREPWYNAPLIHNNVRSQNIHRWHSDNSFGMRYTGAGSGSTSGARAHLYSYGPVSQTREFPQWSDVVNSVELDAGTGNYRTGPFFDASSSSSGVSVYPLFDIPDKELTLHSLGSLQHVQFTSQVWHPSYIVGNGFASPYIDPATTSKSFGDEENDWNKVLVTLQSGVNDLVHKRDDADDNPFIYDVSYETNFHLWDKYFLSSLPHKSSAKGWDSGSWGKTTPLPNSRMVISGNEPDNFSHTNLTDYHKAAQSLMILGGFNINSTSVRAWEAMLRSFNGLEIQSREGTTTSTNPFSRFLTPQMGGDAPSDATDSNLWAGYRDLSDSETKELASKIVTQVKKRAPFISVGDFVNRRLGSLDGNDDELQLFGALQAAINQSQINSSLDSTQKDDYSMPSASEAEAHNYSKAWDHTVPDPQEHETFQYKSAGGSDTHRLSKASGASGHLNQADILQQIGSVLTARSDTFKIRCYGDSTDIKGKVIAKAWCEANVQRIIHPVTPDPTSKVLNPTRNSSSDLGRKFVITSFRWLNGNETGL